MEIMFVGIYAETSPAWVRKRSHAAAAQRVGEVRGTLQQTGMQVEYVAGVGFTTRGTLQQKAQGTVGYRMLGQVVVNYQHVPAVVHEELAHRTAGIRRDVL